MTKSEDRAAEWKRASGVWQSWSELHWKESGTNPFEQRAEPAATPRAEEDCERRREERPDRV